MTKPTTDLKIEKVPLADLTLDPNNARTHDEDNLKAITHSLNKFGQTKPLVVSASGTIYAGNGTYLAAQALGWEQVDIVRLPADWSDERAMAYALADNRTGELAEWDQKTLGMQLLELDANGWDIKELGFNDIPNLESLITPPTDIPQPPIGEDKILRCPKCGFEWQNVKGI